MSNEPAPPSNPAPRKSRRGVKIVIGVVLLLVVPAAGATAWWLLRGTAQPAPAVGASSEKQHHGVLAFEPFLVNLADKDTPCFLRVSLALVVDDQESVKEIEEDRVRLLRARSAILELLAAQTSVDLGTVAGKSALKKTIATRSSEVLRPIEVKDVLFSDFVVQY